MSDVANGRALFPAQRHERILALLGERGRVDVSELAEDFEVTTETIRKDLTELQRRRLVKRVHGGAVPWGGDGFQPLLAMRDLRNPDQKRRIGAAAAQGLPPAGTVLLDSGSTTAYVAQQLPPDCELTVITNSLVATQILSAHERVRVVLLGGAVDKDTQATVDAETIRSVTQLHVDAVVLGADGLSPTGGLTTPSRVQAELKRAMIAAAGRVVAVTDHSKFGVDQQITFAACREVDELITDDGMPDDHVAALAAAGLTVVRV